MLLRAFLLTMCSLMYGCAGVFDYVEPGQESAVRVGRAPLVSDRFLLTSASQQVIGRLQAIETNYEDTFVDIARIYNLGFDELVQANPDVDPWLPGQGTRVILPTRFVLPDAPREGIVIDIASKRLFYYLPPDEAGASAVVTYPIGIGRSGAATPVGQTTVTSKGRDPVWFPPASIRREYAAEGNPLPARVMPGPDNPLGHFVMVLGMPSYLIHGTNRPAGVGMRVSHGCIRLFPENIASLYEYAPVGVAVNIVNQPWRFAWDGNELLLEAHPALSDDERSWPDSLPEIQASALGNSPQGTVIDSVRVATITSQLRGVPLPVDAKAAAIEHTLQAALAVNNLVNMAPLNFEDADLVAQKSAE